MILRLLGFRVFERERERVRGLRLGVEWVTFVRFGQSSSANQLLQLVVMA